jgi:hypothetical protein
VEDAEVAMNDGTSLPFEKKTLFLKQVRVSDLAEEEKLTLHFFSRDITTGQAGGKTEREIPFQYGS